MPPLRETFVTQVSAEILLVLRALAEREGRPLQVLVEEAFADLLEKRTHAMPRRHVMTAYRASVRQYGALYATLAQ